MDRKMKKQLQQIYEAPSPRRKEEFLQAVQGQDISYGEFLKMQIHYISRWSFITAVIVFIIALFMARRVENEIIWFVSAAIPFLALSTAAEGSRSARYKMDELEMASRFSTRAVMAARMGVLGAGNLLLLALMIPVFGTRIQMNFLISGIHILCPYLLTAFIDMVIVRKMHGRESLYPCLGATVLVSGLCITLGVLRVPALELLRSGTWTVVLLVLLFLTVKEAVKLLKQAEEYVWN